MMNLIQAMEILNQYRPNRPRSLEKKKLQEAIDTLNEYVDATPEGFKYRCVECKYCKLIDGKGKPFGSGTQVFCSMYEWNISNNSISAGLCFCPKEDNNEKTD